MDILLPWLFGKQGMCVVSVPNPSFGSLTLLVDTASLRLAFSIQTNGDTLKEAGKKGTTPTDKDIKVTRRRREHVEW
jgi:hypothetical protein